jgi:predicted PurR-regulated permease PerM
MPALRQLDLQPGTVLRTVLTVLLVLFAVYLIYLLRKPLSWFVIAAFIAVAVSGPVSVASRYMPRGLAIALVYIALLAVPCLIGAALIPPLVSQAEELARNVPQYVQDVREFVNENDTLRSLNEDYNLVDTLQSEAEKLPAQIGNATEILSDIGARIVSSVFAVVTVLILSIFLVSGGAKWVDRFLAVQEPEHAERMRRTLDRVADAISKYVAGALIQATIAGVAGFIMLTILDAPFAGALAILVFFGDLIPVVGATIAAVLVGIVMLFVNFPVGVIVWAVYAIVFQQVENYVVQPQIQRRAVQVEPIVILIAVLCGATLFGVIGALLAIPTAATIQIAAKEWIDYRRSLVAERERAGRPAGPAAPPAAGSA